MQKGPIKIMRGEEGATTIMVVTAYCAASIYRASSYEYCIIGLFMRPHMGPCHDGNRRPINMSGQLACMTSLKH